MSCEEFDALYESAGGRCEICGVPEESTPRGVLVIDHDHAREWEPGCVRALLCDRCNALVKQIDALGPDVIVPAKATAARRGETLSQAIRRFLKEYSRDAD